MKTEGPFSQAASAKPVKSPRPGQGSLTPYNPGLHERVAGKNAWTEPLSEAARAQGFLGWHQRGYIPHCDFPGATQLVTLRLQDSMPAGRRSEWAAMLRLADQRERRTQLEAYLDRGFGACQLSDPTIATLAENALRFFDGQRYQLQAWVMMPNHLHVLVDIWQTPMAEVAKSWKQFIARHANQQLRREGRLWEREYWDTMIKDESHWRKAVHYIEANPVKAGFVQAASEWAWSSARLRDEFGRLPKPHGGPRAPFSQPA
jgi:REP element-mobilizing transposase RayT